MSTLSQTLEPYEAGDLTVRICSTIFQVVPGGPAFEFYNTVEGGVRRYDALAGPGLITRATALLEGDDAKAALRVAAALDTADAGLGVYSGVKNVLGLLVRRSGRARTFESDPQQATDALLKAVGLAYMIHRLFPGSVDDKLTAFWKLKGGQEIATYYVTAEVALPFADNLASGSGNLIERLTSGNEGGLRDRFDRFVGHDAFGHASSVLNRLKLPLADYLQRAGGHTSTVADRVKGLLPGAMNMFDSVSGAVATGIDLRPAWRFLGSRLIVEACAAQASRER
ncbi:MAG: hypothetical protein IT183_05750 [Acidobacteria bacterium]|nr:hypothetical protein [Acidobacteriota bacterium]